MWNAAEACETRSNSVTAREWERALPSEILDAARIEITRAFAAQLVERYGVAADVAIHAPHREGDQRNHSCPHSHNHPRFVCRGADRQDPHSRCGQHGRGGAEIEAMRGVWANCKTMPLNWRGQEVSIDHRSLEMQGEEALSLGDTVKAEELDREPELKLGPAANAIERREQFAAEVEGRDYEPLTQRGARVHAVRQAKAMFVEMRARLELARYARAEAREEGHVSAGLAALRAVAGGKRKSWTRTRPSSGWRTLRGVIWGKMAPAMRLGPTLSATGLSRCSRAASPIRASSSSEGWRRSAKSSVCLSWKGNAHAIEIRAGSCDFYLHRDWLHSPIECSQSPPCQKTNCSSVKFPISQFLTRLVLPNVSAIRTSAPTWVTWFATRSARCGLV